MKKVERWKMEMPTEQEMLPKDKYSVFDRKVKRYRKGIHSTCGVDELEVLEGRQLTKSRGTEVDESQPETQSSWFLDGRVGGLKKVGCILSVMIPLHQIRRNMDEYSHFQLLRPAFSTHTCVYPRYRRHLGVHTQGGWEGFPSSLNRE